MHIAVGGKERKWKKGGGGKRRKGKEKKLCYKQDFQG